MNASAAKTTVVIVPSKPVTVAAVENLVNVMQVVFVILAAKIAASNSIDAKCN